MIKLQLTTWDRVSLLRVIEGQSGDMKFVRQAGRIMDALELTEAEQKEVGMVQAENGLVTWKDAARTFEIELRESDAQLLRALFPRHMWSGGVVRLVAALATRLGVPAEADEPVEATPLVRPAPPAPERT